jgi:hypothetical protein
MTPKFKLGQSVHILVDGVKDRVQCIAYRNKFKDTFVYVMENGNNYFENELDGM